VIVDHSLISCAILRATEKQAAVGPEIVVHLQHHLEVAVLLLRDDDAAVAGDVLAADDSAVFDDPLAAGLVLAGGGVAGLGGNGPALEGFAVEDAGEPGVVELLGLGQLGGGRRGNEADGGKQSGGESHWEAPGEGMR
jgi:hypothetical protein